MTLHNEIINIACDPIEGTESEVLAFKLGHKQAQRAAAELAARFGEWQNEAAAGLAHFVSLSSKPNEREWFKVASKVPALLGNEDAKSKCAIDDEEEPASLSKAMKFLESKDVQLRREQKLREEVSALRASLRRCLSEAEGWLAEAHGVMPESDIDYDGWADDARRLLREGN